MARNRLGIVAVAVAPWLLALGQPASANIVLDFESLARGSVLAGSGSAFVSSEYEDAGFTVSSSGFGSWGTANRNYAGSTSLFALFAGDVTTLASTDGSTFDLHSMDLSRAFNSGTGGSVRFTGVRQNGTVVVEDINLGNSFGFGTYTFDSFQGVSSVSWSQGDIYHQFDNLVLGRSVIPVPGTVLLGALGLGLIGLGRRFI